MRFSKPVRELIARMQGEGWVIARTKRHIVLKRGNQTAVLPKTPGDHRALKNALRQIPPDQPRRATSDRDPEGMA